ncbi:MAG: hypothetical protein JSW15_09710, partial [Deltaproteobacteria bacterium]
MPFFERPYPKKNTTGHGRARGVRVSVITMKLPAASCGGSKRNCAVAKPAFALTSYGAVHLAF